MGTAGNVKRCRGRVNLCVTSVAAAYHGVGRAYLTSKGLFTPDALRCGACRVAPHRTVRSTAARRSRRERTFAAYCGMLQRKRRNMPCRHGNATHPVRTNPNASWLMARPGSRHKLCLCLYKPTSVITLHVYRPTVQ